MKEILRPLRDVVADWEAEHGAISPEELEAVEQKLAAARHSAQQRVADAGRQQAL